MYKNNSRFSSKFRGCSPLQLLCNLTGMKPANGYYSYTNRWLPSGFRPVVSWQLIPPLAAKSPSVALLGSRG